MVNKKVIAGIIIAILVVAVVVSVVELQKPKVAHPSVFTDVAQTAAPSEGLDPATGFFTTDEPLFTAIYQSLVEYNVTNTNEVVPVLAQNVSYNVSDPQFYNFTMRPYLTYSNGDSVNATAVWFSYYRGILMGQGPFSSDYSGILFNGTDYSTYHIALPWGIKGALEHAGYSINGKNTSDNITIEANDLANVLSNFTYNETDWKLMTAPNQAIYLNANEINSTHPLNLTIETEHPYTFLLQDIAATYGAVIEPSYVDSHGGVQVNSENSYLNEHGAIGTGPYNISSVSSGYSTIVIVKNPHYWANGKTITNASTTSENSTTHIMNIATSVNDVPYVASPASIPQVNILYGLSHADRVSDFDTNASALSVVAPSGYKDIIDHYFNASDRNTKLQVASPLAEALFISLNTQRSPTNNTDFRKALVYALNYSAQMSIYKNSFNGSALAFEELGPVSPSMPYYNPNNDPLQSQNLTMAIHYMTLAMDQLNGYVKLPNGTKIGDGSTDFSAKTYDITGTSPPTGLETEQITLAITSFKSIGLTFKSKYDSEGTVLGWTSPGATPRFIDLGWVPDYPDSISQQLEAVYSPAFGGAFGGNDAWVNNTTLNNMFKTLDFLPAAQQAKDMHEVYNITDNISAYIWLPASLNIVFIQPYIHHYYYNEYTGYFYNLMTSSYQFKESRSSSGSGSSVIVGSFMNLVANVVRFEW